MARGPGISRRTTWRPRPQVFPQFYTLALKPIVFFAVLDNWRCILPNAHATSAESNSPALRRTSPRCLGASRGGPPMRRKMSRLPSHTLPPCRGECRTIDTPCAGSLQRRLRSSWMARRFGWGACRNLIASLREGRRTAEVIGCIRSLPLFGSNRLHHLLFARPAGLQRATYEGERWRFCTLGVSALRRKNPQGVSQGHPSRHTREPLAHPSNWVSDAAKARDIGSTFGFRAKV